nr:hypothetical protein [Tanacetum cinerariifolium]
MEQPNPPFSKILILDTGKFKQWKFKIQQYLQNEHYALWEVIEFGDSYEASQVVADTGSASEDSAKKKGRTIAVTTEDMQKRRNDVKARTTLLLALPDEHQLRFRKYKTAQELAPRSQDRGRRENFKQGSKVEESAPKALIAIDGVGWDWSYMANEEEDHALVADQEAPTEFALMAKSSSDTEVFHKLKLDLLSLKIKKLNYVKR